METESNHLFFAQLVLSIAQEQCYAPLFLRLVILPGHTCLEKTCPQYRYKISVGYGKFFSDIAFYLIGKLSCFLFAMKIHMLTMFLGFF
jgi:hypothetical protein